MSDCNTSPAAPQVADYKANPHWPSHIHSVIVVDVWHRYRDHLCPKVPCPSVRTVPVALMEVAARLERAATIASKMARHGWETYFVPLEKIYNGFVFLYATCYELEAAELLQQAGVNLAEVSIHPFEPGAWPVVAGASEWTEQASKKWDGSTS